jgi:hypothetical protein
MFKEAFLTVLFISVAFSDDGFRYIRSDGKSVMYQTSNVAMTWINSAKVIMTLEN